MRLATKITLPFVALFALLLLALGWVLAREILREVEARVENEQRFVLEVAAFPGIAQAPEFLRQIRDTAARAPAPGDKQARGEFIVINADRPLADSRGVLTTFPEDAEIVAGFVAELARDSRLSQSDEAIRREHVELSGRKWLVLHATRAGRGPGALRRHFYLLYPYAEIERVKNSALWRIVGLGSLGLCLAAGLGLLVARWISSPVRRLAGAARRISAGGLSQALDAELADGSLAAGTVPRASPPAGDEIGELALAFCTMLESLRASQQELLKAERLAATGKLAASVAHEIRNPLTSLRMTVQMLQGGTGFQPEKENGQDARATTQEAYRILLGEIDRLALAVDELLTFARPRPPERVPLDLNQLVIDTVAFLERQMQHARVKAITEMDPALPKNLPLDPNKMRQLLVNLLLNALQAIVRDGAITVRTSWNTQAREAVLSVSDTGPGVAAEVRDKLFELFVSTKPSGGGLGLAIAKQIAEEHGGSITYKTSTQGTTFEVHIPQQN